MSEKPEALRLADALRDGTYLLSAERDATEAMLRRQHAEIERLKAALPYDWNMLEACRGSLREHMSEIKRLRGLLREAREYLPEHHPIAESLFPRIDQALQEVPR